MRNGNLETDYSISTFFCIVSDGREKYSEILFTFLLFITDGYFGEPVVIYMELSAV